MLGRGRDGRESTAGFPRGNGGQTLVIAVTHGRALPVRLGVGPRPRCDPYHTGLWAVSQPDVSLQADTNFVQVWAGAAESAWSPGCNEARSGSKPRWTEGTALEETPTARELVTGRCACSHHMGWKSSKAV